MTARPEESARRRVAVALRYRRETESAPVVVASGRGLVADRILEVAREAAVPVHEDAALAESLGALEIDRPIPVELYEAVAEVIAFVHGLRPPRVAT
jgi:flagellar biosynthesis protein